MLISGCICTNLRAALTPSPSPLCDSSGLDLRRSASRTLSSPAPPSYPVGPRLAQSRAFQLLFGMALPKHQSSGQRSTREDSENVSDSRTSVPRRLEHMPSVPVPVAPRLAETKVLSISEALPQSAVDAALHELRPAVVGERQQRESPSAIVCAFRLEPAASERTAASVIAESCCAVESGNSAVESSSVS